MYPFNDMLPSTEGGKIYNISNSGQAICGLEYPNHELYVLDFNTIMQKEGAMIEFVPKEKDNLQDSINIPYKRVYPGRTEMEKGT